MLHRARGVPLLTLLFRATQWLHGAQLSEEFNVAVVITNHVISDPSGGAVFVSDPKKPVGGHVLAHACTIRLSLRKGKGEQRLMKVVDAPNLREPLLVPLDFEPI